MPSAGAENSVVVIADGAPDVVVGYIDQLFGDEDHDYAGTPGNTVEFKLTVEEKSEEEAGGAEDIDRKAGSRDIGLYLDITLTKTKTGESPESGRLSSAGSLLKIVIPYDLGGKTGVVVYRVHEGVAEAMAEQPYSDATPADECYMVNSAGNQVIVWTKSFSTYAIAYFPRRDSGGGSQKYTIAASAGKGGGISPSGNVSVEKGKSRTFTIEADSGYFVSDLLVDGESVGAADSYTFSNVAAPHTIKAVFAEAAGLPYYLDEDGEKVFIGFSSDKSGEMKYIAPEGKAILFARNPKSFTDTAGHWARSHINFVAEREIFLGTGGGFSPNAGMTRAMFAAVIGRLYERSYGEIEASDSRTFADCAYSEYYGKYVDWADEEGIMDGYGNGRFGPDDLITREQMAAILYRFADFLGVADGADPSAPDYSDAAQIASWAREAAAYCGETGLIEGRTGHAFAPRETATRAEVATIIRRLVELTVE